jgi:V/A-type H+-transporting ATPase subunit I
VIAKMLKVYCAARARDRERLVDALGDLGAVHLVPVDPAKAAADAGTSAAIDALGRALQLAASAGAAGTPPEIGGLEAAREMLALSRRATELAARLRALHRRFEALAPWGEVTREALDALEAAGAAPRLYALAARDVPAIRAECVQVVAALRGGKVLAAVVDRGGRAVLPEGAEEVPRPATDRPALRAEAARIEAELAAGRARMRALAGLRESMACELTALEAQAARAIAVRGGAGGEEVFALQGWVPARRAGDLAAGLARAGLDAALRTFEPAEDETPPTLIDYPRWVKPIKGLFDILATLPGYREVDLSPFFIITMPLFAAIIIADAGYGLVFAAAALWLGRKLRRAADKVKAQLLLVIGIATMLWGFFTGSVFGFGPLEVAGWGGAWETAGKAFNAVLIGGRVDGDAFEAALAVSEPAARAAALAALGEDGMVHLRVVLMKLSFLLAVAHLVGARLREAAALAPNQRALASVGWALVLAGMFRVVWFLFFDLQADADAGIPGWTAAVLAAGAALAILFGVPHRSLLRRVGVGFASSLLPLVGTFGDTMSYIRLMALSLAGLHIVQVFQVLAGRLADAATWGAGVPLLVLGHVFNMCLCLIAIFAHGVRLHMLEFSNNAGVTWSGYPFKPFANHDGEER